MVGWFMCLWAACLCMLEGVWGALEVSFVVRERERGFLSGDILYQNPRHSILPHIPQCIREYLPTHLHPLAISPKSMNIHIYIYIFMRERERSGGFSYASG